MRLRGPRPEPLLTEDDVETAFQWMFDVAYQLSAIRRLLEEHYGEAENPADEP